VRPRRLLETSVYASDLEAAERFYAGVLGLDVIGRVAGRHVFFRCGDGVLLVFDPRATSTPDGRVPAHGATGAGHIAFAATATELEAWRTHLEASGIAIEHEATWPGGTRSFYVRDPADNSIEFAEAALWGIDAP
jgi:catechol 2,3-dioxygenase-like lactoylglutathione lyase family enzyme